MSRLTEKVGYGAALKEVGMLDCTRVCKSMMEYDNPCGMCPIQEATEKLAHYEDLEEQGRLIDWKRTSEEKPNSTRHLIAAYGEIISHYAYYLKPKDKWFTDWTCEKEIDAPMFWADMPDPPKESLCGECCAKMVKGTEE